MQLVVNILVTGSQVILVAVGFSLIFCTARFFHFAHGIILASGAYLAFLLFGLLSMPLSVSIALSVALCAAVGYLIELGIYRPLRSKGSSELVFLLASLGIYIVLQNALSMYFGDATKTLRSDTVTEGFKVLGARITSVQSISILSSLTLVGVLSLFLNKTKIGISIKATANDPDLASVSGISPKKVFACVFCIGSALAGVAGLLVAFDVDMTPTMGMNPLMLGVVAVIIGGTNSIPGIALGALLLAVAQHLGAWYVGSEFQDGIVFVILILFLLFRPEGFFGKKVRSAAV